MNWDWEKLRDNQQKYEKKQGGGGPGMPRPPQVDELLNKFKGFRFPGVFLVGFVLLALYMGSSTFFTVDRNEVGVIQRFGKYNRLAQPGLNFKLPSGIEKVTKVNVKTPETEEFGFNTTNSNKYRTSAATPRQESSLMLTGDLNVAVIPWIVQYRRSDPRAFLFNVKNVKSLLRHMSESTMRTVVGDRSINEVISSREEIALAAKVMLQKEMDNSETGISIVNIEMKKTNVPEPVQASFNEVNQAIQEKEQTIYKAREEYNKAVPLARGEAKRLILDAEGYAIDRVNRAQGDATKFKAIYDAYAQAKEVTKKRMYLEAMLEVIPNLGQKYIIDSDQKNLLPFLNMGANGSPLISPKLLGKGE